MTLQQAHFHIKELMKHNYVIPVFNKLEAFQSVPPEFPFDERFELRSIFECIGNQISKLQKDRKELAETLVMAVDYGWTYPYTINPNKQEFLNELSEKYPDIKWPIMYPPTCTYNEKEKAQP